MASVKLLSSRPSLHFCIFLVFVFCLFYYGAPFKSTNIPTNHTQEHYHTQVLTPIYSMEDSVDSVPSVVVDDFCSYEVWVEYFSLGEKILSDSEAIIRTDQIINERMIHHVIAQAKHFLSGLISVQSVVMNVHEVADTCREITRLVDYFHEELIPKLKDKLDLISLSESYQLPTVQQLGHLDNELILLDMEQVSVVLAYHGK